MRNDSIRPRAMLLALVLVTLTAGTQGFAQTKAPASDRSSNQTAQYIMREVHHELVTLPHFTIFDNLAYSIKGTEVTLTGQVRVDTVKQEAEAAVKGIKGVTAVHDNIEVLPDSSMDDQIRQAEFRAIYGEPALQRYAEGSMPPIHIIVKQGHVTLEGVVANQSDSNLANVRANGVPGVFSVTNNLRLDAQS